MKIGPEIMYDIMEIEKYNLDKKTIRLLGAGVLFVLVVLFMLGIVSIQDGVDAYRFCRGKFDQAVDILGIFR